ncbi:MAG TPA: flagellar biosynthesis protein FlhF [Clostridia bacterium]|nr:flagellar biosynthesis protein FlhF [Clostridia bacterium]
MRIKRAIGKDAHEAVSKIKENLGPDAVILHTRSIRQKGFKGMFVKPLVEVVAASDETVYGKQSDVLLKESEQRLKALEEKYNVLDRLVREYLHGITGSDAVSVQKTAKVEEIRKTLIANDVAAIAAKKFSDLLDSMAVQAGNFTDIALELIEKQLGKACPITLQPNKRKVAIFVGPTGIGKTTTLAKIAAIYTLEHGKKVGLITADTYRIAAHEQLKTYAELLRVPISVVYSAGEVASVLKEYSDMDLVLIDTAGKSIEDPNHPKEVAELIKASNADEVFLLLSATTAYSSCQKILENYSFLDTYKLIFTKIDEAKSCGLILNVRMITDKPLAYITCGQNVPDDIRVANPRTIAEMLLGIRTAI